MCAGESLVGRYGLWNHLEAKPLLGPWTADGFKQKSFILVFTALTLHLNCHCPMCLQPLLGKINSPHQMQSIKFFFQDLIILFNCKLCMEFAFKIIKKYHISSDHNNYSWGKESTKQASTRLSFCRYEELSLSDVKLLEIGIFEALKVQKPVCASKHYRIQGTQVCSAVHQRCSPACRCVDLEHLINKSLYE